MKIKSIHLKNFKQFENFSVSCREMNVLTGPNNAGKSSILDALRICSDVVRFSSRRRPLLTSQLGFGVCPTYSIDDGSISIDIKNVVRDYGEERAEITLKLVNGNCIVVQLHPNSLTTAFLVSDERAPKTSKGFKTLAPVKIIVVPTLSPFETREAWVTEETTRKNEGTRLASRSFRNIWLRKTSGDLENFNLLVKRGWSDIYVEPPSVDPNDQSLRMYFSEKRKLREVHWAGFGFQVWLQMMTQIMRGDENSILVLDEPDIYLHPDLQRKLARLVQEKFGQVFLATHSTEIINEVNSGDVLSIEGRNRNARRISSEDDYRHIFSYLGSSENAEFSRMARARRIVFFEGDDRKLLRKFAQKVLKGGLLDDTETVFLKTGGFGQWRRVIGVEWTLENLFGMTIKIAAVFDRDYRCQEEINEFIKEVSGPAILCQVLQRKEIENYALQAPVLIRTMQKIATSNGCTMSIQQCETLFDEIFDQMYKEVRANVTGDFIRHHEKLNKQWSKTTAVSEALSEFDGAWSERSRRFELVGGKDFLSTLSHLFQKLTKKSITISQIINEMHVSELPADLSDLIKNMESFFCT